MPNLISNLHRHLLQLQHKLSCWSTSTTLTKTVEAIPSLRNSVSAQFFLFAILSLRTSSLLEKSSSMAINFKLHGKQEAFPTVKSEFNLDLKRQVGAMTNVKSEPNFKKRVVMSSVKNQFRSAKKRKAFLAAIAKENRCPKHNISLQKWEPDIYKEILNFGTSEIYSWGWECDVCGKEQRDASQRYACICCFCACWNYRQRATVMAE